MRHLLAAAVFVAACSVIAVVPARAEPIHYSGGPLVEGKMCWTSTSNDLGYGYWVVCPTAPHAARHKKH